MDYSNKTNAHQTDNNTDNNNTDNNSTDNSSTGSSNAAGSSSSSLETLLENLRLSSEKNGPDHQETATYHYQLGLYYISHGDAMEAMSHLGDALYIRRKAYTEDSLRIREIYYALEQCTFM